MLKTFFFFAEEKKEQDKQWKRMKLGFYFFGISMGGMGAWTLYDMGQPERDSEGREIEDEFTNQPTFERYKNRILKSLNYYQKVRIANFIHAIHKMTLIVFI
jgi:mitochondrial import inner membrane translocase subunit TIM50